MSDEVPEGLVQDLELRAERAEEDLDELREALGLLAKRLEAQATFEEQESTTETECAVARGLRRAVTEIRALLPEARHAS